MKILKIFLAIFLASPALRSEEAKQEINIIKNQSINSEHIFLDKWQRALGPSISGKYIPELEAFDKIISGAMLTWNIQGGSVAVAKDGKLLYARGFGKSDSSGNQVMPDTVFRVASVSKIITSMTILFLVNNNKLNLDDKVLDLLKSITRVDDIIEKRWKNITVKNLLYHNSGVPQNDWCGIKDRQVLPNQITTDAILKHLLTQSLLYDPGSQFQYNNQNYLILGRIIEEVSGKKYDEFIKKAILLPLGITNMDIGKSKKNQRLKKEVEYGLGQKMPTYEAVTMEQNQQTEAPYTYCIEAMDSFGGWVASAADIVRFVLYFDGFSEPKDLINNTLWQQMVFQPDFSYVKKTDDYWQGMGWSVRKNGGGFNYWHNGSIWGTKSQVVRTADGYVWCWIFNGEVDQNIIDGLMWSARAMVTSVPNIDLSSELFPVQK
jgi:N-acyl-D-amino-acid deacylase